MRLVLRLYLAHRACALLAWRARCGFQSSALEKVTSVVLREGSPGSIFHGPSHNSLQYRVGT